MHERPSTRAEPALHNECVPRSEEHLGNRRGIGEGHRLGNRHQLTFVGAHEFGVGAARFDGHHLVARLPERHPFPHRAHLAAVFESGDLERLPASRIGITAHALQDVGTIQCGRPHRHQHLIGRRHRRRHVFDGQNLRSAVRAQYDGAHRLRTSSAADGDRAPRGNPRW